MASNVDSTPPGQDSTNSAQLQESRAGSELAIGAGVAGGTVFLFLLIRIMAVAHWDWNTASNIADSVDFSDATSVVLGTLFADPEITAVAVVLLLPLALVQLAWNLNRRRHAGFGHWMLVAFLIITVSVLTSTFKSWWLPVVATVFTAALVAMRWGWRTGQRRAAIRGLLRATGKLTFTAALILAIVVDTPWQLQETIYMQDQSPIRAYVLKVSSGYLKVLIDEPREVVILNRDDVDHRTIVPDA